MITQLFFMHVRYVIQQQVSQMAENTRTNNFIGKFHSILQNPMYQDIIRFDQTKTKIIVADKSRFQNEILPFYFRHKNFRSFVRLLNLYGFKKPKNQRELCFSHPVMLRGEEFQTIVSTKKRKNDDLNSSSSQQQPQTHQQIIQSSEFYRSAVEGKRAIQNIVKMQQYNQPIIKMQSSEITAKYIRSAGDRRNWNFASPQMSYLVPPTYKYPCQPFIMNFYPPQAQ